MEKAKETTDIAYLRALDAKNQCELSFLLNVKSPECNLEEQIDAVRQIADTVSSLLTHIQNKIFKLVQDNASKENKENNNCEIPISLKRNNAEVPKDTTCKSLIEETKGELVFSVFHQRFRVVINAPIVQFINLPKVIYAKCMIQPERCKTLYTKYDLSEFVWFKSSDRENWTEVANKYTYKVKNKDVGCYLKFRYVPKNRKVEGPAFDVISDNAVQKLPEAPRCPFEDRHLHTKTKVTGKEWRVISYNTLSHRYIGGSETFPYCNEKFLSIDYRRSLIAKEIIGYNADIICLQEVDLKEYTFYYSQKFKKAGYKSIFHKKGNKIPEGLCCVYNDAKFSVLETRHVVLSDVLNKNKDAAFANLRDILKENRELQDLLSKQITSLQVTVLKSKTLNGILFVANTHLYYHSEAGHVRLIQVATALEYIRKLKDAIGNIPKFKSSVLFCGDFNSTPPSGVYKFLVNGKIDSSEEDCKKISETEDVSLTHPFTFESACGTPEFTNYTDNFKGCLDYIFFEKTDVAVTSVVPLFPETVLSENVALPSAVFPSDHLALVANLMWRR